MFSAWRHCVAALLGAAAITAQAAEPAIYPPPLLAEWQGEFESVLNGTLHEVVLKRLTSEEAARVRGIQLAFPLDGRLWPFDFTVQGGVAPVITMPIASLMFLKDVSLAESWLHVNGWSTGALLDYMGALRFGRLAGVAPGRRGPLAALGIPADAANDRRVLDRRNETLDKLVLFIIAHELGHLLQPDGLAPQARCQRAGGLGCDRDALRRSEMAADEIAVDLMRRVGSVPNAAALFFALDSRYLGLPAEPGADGERSRGAALTHPVDAERVRALRAAIDDRQPAFVRQLRDPSVGLARLRELSDSLRELADGLANPLLARHQTFVAKTLEPQDLLPRSTPVPTLRPGLEAQTATGPATGYHRGEMRMGSTGAPMSVEVLWNTSSAADGAQVMVQGIRGRLSGRNGSYVLDLGGDVYDLRLGAEPAEQPIEGTWRSRGQPSVGGVITLRRLTLAERLKV